MGFRKYLDKVPIFGCLRFLGNIISVKYLWKVANHHLQLRRNKLIWKYPSTVLMIEPRGMVDRKYHGGYIYMCVLGVEGVYAYGFGHSEKSRWSQKWDFSIILPTLKILFVLSWSITTRSMVLNSLYIKNTVNQSNPRNSDSGWLGRVLCHWYFLSDSTDNSAVNEALRTTAPDIYLPASIISFWLPQ